LQDVRSRGLLVLQAVMYAHPTPKRPGDMDGLPASCAVAQGASNRSRSGYL